MFWRVVDRALPSVRDFPRQEVRIPSEGELTSWTVAVVGAPANEGRRQADLGVRVAMIKRKGESGDETRYSIGRLLSPRDEAIDLDTDAWAAALELTRRIWKDSTASKKAAEEPDMPSGAAIRQVRGFGAEGVAPHPERGLLLLYALDPLLAYAEPGDPRAFTFDTPIVAFGVSFPGSRSGTKVIYKVNNVGWEQDYGASE